MLIFLKDYSIFELGKLQTNIILKMKRLFTLLLVLSLLAPVAFAQKGLHVGANGMGLTPFITNTNMWGPEDPFDIKVTFSRSFGFDAGYNFTDNLGIYTGFWFMNMGQDYTDDINGTNYTRDIILKYNMIPIMLKFTGSESRVNFIGGFGILYAMLSEAEQIWRKDGNEFTNSGTSEDLNGDEFIYTAKNVTSRFEKNDIILNFELGARIMIIDNLYADATLNFGYGIKDINAEAFRIPDSDNTYTASHNAYGGFKVGVAYVLFGD